MGGVNVDRRLHPQRRRYLRRLPARKRLPIRFWLQRIIPVGAFQALTLATGNAVYLYLGVSLVQMLKAGTPVIIMAMLYFSGMQRMSREVFACVIIMALGSGGTVGGVGGADFSAIGVAIMMVSELAEAGRCVLTQFVLKDSKLSVVEGQYYLAPASLCSLLLYSAVHEWGDIYSTQALAKVIARPWWFVASGVLGIAVNFASFLVIQTSSALLLKMLVTARNAGLVIFSVLMLGEVVTTAQLGGYAVTLVAFSCYNYYMLPEHQRCGGRHRTAPAASSEATKL